MGNRFDYVKYDEQAVKSQANFKTKFQDLEKDVDALENGRAKSLILTKLEEAYMWVGKAIRDDQVAKRGGDLQEGRSNG